MISSKGQGHVARSVGGKTARACDSCIRRRARWYCTADDAFLCQLCDSSVHSANPLARRHERVRLKTASLKSLSVDATTTTTSNTNTNADNVIQQQPSWVRGVTKKARTPRPNNNKTASSPPPPPPSSKSIEETLTISRGVPLVPELGSDDISNNNEEEEHQLLYRVPIFNPLELGNNNNNNNSNSTSDAFHHHHHQTPSMDSSLQGLVMPSDMDLAEFAADVESLLGRGLENESFGMEELGILDSCTSKLDDQNKLVKMEREEEVDEEMGVMGGIDLELEMAKEEEEEEEEEEEPPFQLSFDYDSPCDVADKGTVEVGIIRGSNNNYVTSKEEQEEDSSNNNNNNNNNGNKKRKSSSILLSLNYEAVITAWSSTQGSSPWTNGHRPDFDPNECWPDCMGGCGREFMHHHYQYHHHNHGYSHHGEGEFGVGVNSGVVAGGGDGGREARVSRYREKRRTRLFSKKIRYEVRKLNAEKRPRMKGRFVKRTTSTGTSFAGTSASPLLQPYTSLLLNNNK